MRNIALIIAGSSGNRMGQDIISSNIAICKAYGYAITGIQCREAI